MRRTVLLDIVGLTRSLIGEHTPHLRQFLNRSTFAAMSPSVPAVTSTVQASMLTGKSPAEHGVVGNGWYDRTEGEIRFWRRSSANILAEPVWSAAKRLDPAHTTAVVGFMHAMFSDAEFVVAARPSYPADGRKIPDCYGKPDALRHRLQRELGPFPLFKFWGPMTGIESTRWLADAAITIDRWHAPTLSLVYLPHLDYGFQRFGPDVSKVAGDLRAVDAEAGRLIDHFEAAGCRVIVVSEYGITAVSKPLHLNRELRRAGLIAIREELGRELLEPGDSEAFAVADHQVAHVYVRDAGRVAEVKRLLESVDGVAEVCDAAGKRELGLDHARSGELVALAKPDAWFTYYYWLDDAKRPDFATTVDIHRKPGYDPAELFLDPSIALPKLRVARKLALRKLGFRTLLDVIPASAEMVGGSHGLLPASDDVAPLVIDGGGSKLPPLVADRDVFAMLLGES